MEIKDINQKKMLKTMRDKTIGKKPKIGIYIPARNAGKTIIEVLDRIPQDIKEKVAETEARSEKLDIARNLARNQGHVLRVLRELYERMPEGISLATLSYERDRALIIKGTAKDLSDVFQFIPVLEKSPYFESVASQYASKRKVLDKEYTDFQIQCMLSP